jgi:SAM-dependent methyltransferase
MPKKNNFGAFANYYDLFELKSSSTYSFVLNVLEDYFTQHGVNTVLDMACGTGAQTIPLAKKGYHVTACDSSSEMLQIAQQKAKDIKINFYQCDMQNPNRGGVYDAIIAILNSISYLSREDFFMKLENMKNNIRDGGLFIFDITNLDAVKAGAFVEGKLIDTAGEHQGLKFVRFTQSTINIALGLMVTHWESFIQQDFQHMKRFSGTWYRQTYRLDELEQILFDNGFHVIKYLERNGASFNKTQSYSVLVITEKLNRP